MEIVDPSGGVEQGETLELRATVSDPKAQRAVLTVNGASYDVPISGGEITQTIVPMPGNNRVGIVVEHEGQVARDSVTFRHEGVANEMMVMLTWEAHGEIIDLWVRDPGGETCKWDHRQTSGGAHLLDFSSAAIGFGSQAFVTPEVHAGRYRIKIHYWGAYDPEDTNDFYALRGMLDEIDEIDATAPRTDHERGLLAERRRALTSRVDAWGLASGSQTPVHAEVVLFPGTSVEERHRFDVIVERTGQLATIGEVDIAETSIRRARTERR